MSEASHPFEKILSYRRFDAIFLAASCLAAFFYRGWPELATLVHGVPVIQHISYDGVYYAQIARNLLAGDGPGWEAMIFPVLQPLFVAGLSAVTGIANYAFLGQLVNTIAGALVLVPVYFIAKEFFGRKAAVFAVMVLIPYPQIVTISTSDTAESLYSFFVYASIWAGMAALKGPSYRRAAVAGLVLGLGYLARPEGLLIFAAFLPLMFIRLRGLAGAKRAAISTLVVVVAFWAVALPYAVFLYNSYGRVVLSCKLPFESIKMREAVLGMPLSTSDVYGITRSGRMEWQDHGGAGVVIGYIKADPKRFFGAYLRNLMSELPWKLAGNSSHMAYYPDVYPLYFWIPALVGLIMLIFRRKEPHLIVLLLIPYINMFVFPVFTAGFWVYNAPYLPTMVILATGAVAMLVDRLRPDSRAAVAVVAVCTVAWWTYSVKVVKFSNPEDVISVKIRTMVSDESQDVGRNMRKYLGTNVSYLETWSRMVFYLGGRWVDMPAGSNYDIVRYGIRHRADYIVEELKNKSTDTKFRFASMPGLTLIYTYRSDDVPYAMAIWKITDPAFYR